ncbi:hypothetical protein [Ruminococcus sp.]
MYFNSEDFRTLADAVVQYSDPATGSTHQQAEQTCKEVFFRLSGHINNYDMVEDQSLISAVLREYRISHYLMDGVRSVMGSVVLNSFLNDGACVLIFFRQRDLCKYLTAYKPTHKKAKTLAVLTRRYGKIQIFVDRVTQTLTVYQFYRLCCGSGKERTYPFFVVE